MASLKWLAGSVAHTDVLAVSPGFLLKCAKRCVHDASKWPPCVCHKCWLAVRINLWQPADLHSAF